MAEKKYCLISGAFCLLTLLIIFLMYWVVYNYTTETFRKTLIILSALVTLIFCCKGTADSN